EAGPYRVENGRFLVPTPSWETSALVCIPNLDAHERWVAAFIGSGPSLSIDEPRFTLVDDGLSLTFLDVDFDDPALALTATPWRLDTVLSGEMLGLGDWPATTFEFFDDGSFRSSPNGCPAAAGLYEVIGEQLELARSPS